MTWLPARKIGLGTMSLTASASFHEAEKLVDQFLGDAPGLINLADFDYSGRSEAWIGRMMCSPGRRERAFLSIELSGQDMGVPHDPRLDQVSVRRAVHRALRRLRVDYVDLVNIPRPNFTIEPAEPLAALTELVEEGSVRHVGTSTFPAWHILEYRQVALSGGLVAPRSDLSPYNVLDRRVENELLPMAARFQVDVLVWAPLAGGILAGRYQPEAPWPPDSRAELRGGVYAHRVTPAGQRIAEKLCMRAAKLGWSGGQLALRWVLSQPAVRMAIIGPRSLGQLHELVAVEREDRHDAAIEAAVDDLTHPGTAVCDFFNTAPWMQMGVSPPPVPRH